MVGGRTGPGRTVRLSPPPNPRPGRRPRAARWRHSARAARPDTVAYPHRRIGRAHHVRAIPTRAGRAVRRAAPRPATDRNRRGPRAGPTEPDHRGDPGLVAVAPGTRWTPDVPPRGRAGSSPLAHHVRRLRRTGRRASNLPAPG